MRRVAREEQARALAAEELGPERARGQEHAANQVETAAADGA
jgi:hypothetical protein